MNTIAMALMAAAVAAAFLLFGWIFGSRVSHAARGSSRAEGRAEAAVDLARAQEKIVFLEQCARQERDRVGALEFEIKGVQERARLAQTECVQLRERLEGLSEAENARAQAEGTAARTSTELATQRELVSRLTAQSEGMTSAAQRLQERVIELTQIEQALRVELSHRDDELVSQRESASSLRAQLEAVTMRETQAKERVTELVGLERSLRGHVSDRDTTLRALSEQVSALRAELDGAKTSLGQLSDAQVQWDRERAALGEQAVRLNVTNAELQTALSNERTHSGTCQ